MNYIDVLGNTSLLKTDNLAILSNITFPTQSIAASIIGNVRYNTSTGKLQLCTSISPVTWADIDTSAGSNYWEIIDSTYLQPISTYTDGIKVDNISEKSTGLGITMNNKLYVNNIESYGTDTALTFRTNGIGMYKFIVDPTPFIGKFQINASGMTSGEEIDFYLGKDTTAYQNTSLIGYGHNSSSSLAYTYIGLRNDGGTSIDKRMYIYGTGDTIFPGSIYARNNDNTEGASDEIQIGVDANYCGQFYHYYSSTAANRYISMGYKGQVVAIQCYGNGKTHITSPYIDTIYGISNLTSGTIWGIPVTSSTIPASNIAITSSKTVKTNVNDVQSAGIIGSPPTITDNNDGTCTIAATTCQIRATNDPSAEILFLSIPQASISITQAATEYIYASYSAGNVTYGKLSSISTDYQTKILIAQIYRVPLAESNELYINNNVCSCVQDLGKRVINFTGSKVNKINFESGAALGFSGVQWSLTAGSFNMALNMFTTQAKSLAGNFNYLSYNGSVWAEVAATNNINNTQYQGASAFTTMTNNFWAVDFVYITVNPTTKYYIIKSTSEANSLANALNIAVPSNVPQRLINNGILVGKIIFQKSQNINSVVSAFSSTISYQGVTSHSNLANLTTGNDHTQYVLINANQINSTDKIYINNFETFGTNSNMNFTTNGSGGYIFDVQPSSSAVGKFQVMASDAADGDYIDCYVGKDGTHFQYFGYRYKSTLAESFSYLGFYYGTTRFDFKLYGNGVLNWSGGKFDSLDDNTTDGNQTYFRVGSQDLKCGYIKYTYKTDANLCALGIGLQGLSDVISCTGAGNIVLGASTKNITCAGNFFPTPYASASAVEGVLTYDSAAGEKCLKFYNGTGWITLGKSGSNDIKSSTEIIEKLYKNTGDLSNSINFLDNEEKKDYDNMRLNECESVKDLKNVTSIRFTQYRKKMTLLEEKIKELEKKIDKLSDSKKGKKNKKTTDDDDLSGSVYK